MPFWKRGKSRRKPDFDEAAISLIQTHCESTEDSDSWARRIASLIPLDESQVFWEIAILRFFWVRIGVMQNMTDPRPLIDKLHWYFLEGIRTGCRSTHDEMAQFEVVLNNRIMRFTKVFNETGESRTEKADAVSQQFLATLKVPSSADLVAFLTQQADRVGDVRMSIIMRGLAFA